MMVGPNEHVNEWSLSKQGTLPRLPGHLGSLLEAPLSCWAFGGDIWPSEEEAGVRVRVRGNLLGPPSSGSVPCVQEQLTWAECPQVVT